MGISWSKVLESDIGLRMWRWFPRGTKRRVLRSACLFQLQGGAKFHPELEELAQRELERRVMQLLSGYGLDPLNTMIVLHRCEGYISGSAVLWVLRPGSFRPGDIDFYVTQFHAGILWDFLTSSPGWRWVPDAELHTIGKQPMPAYAELPFVKEIWYFFKEGSGQIINVIVTNNDG
ncbi:hypothetical protein CC1G_14121 [Coprinopsis cinerea okayama7|uniref:Uncharacterized protein n=1 Tax=Coprinopsis cinerea (strain Okayama-7 / 130 / ATCC MYA-4618 / FGSC 9003) TaxID=240176 RepID=D6RL54_COPC7|nr:hypothetical protein CC1G_14121 [Coprinopsis cinerea okayama7\|eukprot:XP_002911588.1 hypothetical protein CC1G_14121 [Coprinopsis cinerea okayama7\